MPGSQYTPLNYRLARLSCIWSIRPGGRLEKPLYP